MQDIVGKAFSVYFTFEMMVNVVAKGFIVGPKTYLKDSANWLDAVIVFFGLFLPSTPPAAFH